MKKLIYYVKYFNLNVACIIVMMVCNIRAFSQGSCDVKYISLDSLNTSFIGKQIRIDFKSSEFDTLQGEVNVLDIRKMLSSRDTVNLEIGNKSIRFTEKWKVYVDHLALSEQCLESVGKHEKQKIRIKEMFLESLNDSSVVLRILFSDSPNQNKKQNKKEKMVIKKSAIKGILVNVFDN